MSGTSYEFQIRIANKSGVPKATITDFTYASCETRVNDLGLFVFSLPLEYGVHTRLEPLDVVSFWWRNRSIGIEWRREWIGIFYDLEIQPDSSGVYYMTAHCASGEVLLDEARVAYPAGVEGRSAFHGLPAETIMRSIVYYNAGAGAEQFDGRLVSFPSPEVFVEADQGRGNLISSWSCAHKGVLATLQDLAQIAGGDFGIERDDEAGGWLFRFYPDQRGTDRTTGSGATRVEFSDTRGNIKNGRYKQARRGRATVAVVLGQGEGEERAYTVVRHPTLYTADEHREMIVDARHEPNSDGLYEIGLAKLLEQQPADAFTYEVVQRAGSHYGKHYEVGDRVLARPTGIVGTIEQKVISAIVTASTQSGLVTIDIRMSGQDSDAIDSDERLYESVRRLASRVDSLESH